MENNQDRWEQSSRGRYPHNDRQGRTYDQGNRPYRQSSDNSASEHRPQRPRFNRNGYSNQGYNDGGQRPVYRTRYNGSEDGISVRQSYQSNRPYRRDNGGEQNGERQQGNFQRGGYRQRMQRNPQAGGQRPRFQARPRPYDYKEEVDMTKPVRLNKFLANAGICSRREADEYIEAGVITVNGEVVNTLGAKVLPTDKVMFHDQPVRSERKVYVLLNKPKNTITTTEDPEERNTVLNIVRNVCSERIYPVGRLDRNTTGVLLLTNDGDLAAKLTHPKFGKKKVYQAKLDKPLEQEDYDTIMQGITLDDELIVPDELQYVKEDDKQHIGITIHSGQNRVVRRIFEKVGYKVLKLDRTMFAGLTKKNLGRGKYRFLTPREIGMLKMGAFE